MKKKKKKKKGRKTPKYPEDDKKVSKKSWRNIKYLPNYYLFKKNFGNIWRKFFHYFSANFVIFPELIFKKFYKNFEIVAKLRKNIKLILKNFYGDS